MRSNAAVRRPVYSGNRRIPGLYERTLADGTTVYEAGLRLDGRPTRRSLVARTKTDAILEVVRDLGRDDRPGAQRKLRTLQVDHACGEGHRSPAEALTLNELASHYIAHLRARTNETDPRRRRAPRTVDHYESQLRLHVLPVLGRRAVVCDDALPHSVSEHTAEDAEQAATARGWHAQRERAARAGRHPCAAQDRGVGGHGARAADAGRRAQGAPLTGGPGSRSFTPQRARLHDLTR